MNEALTMPVLLLGLSNLKPVEDWAINDPTQKSLMKMDFCVLDLLLLFSFLYL